MKLNEIFGSETPYITHNKKTWGSTRKGYQKNVVGRGVFSKVAEIPDNPHEIRKLNQGKVRLESDAYYQYIKYIVDNNLAEENTYFPRIYSIELRNGPDLFPNTPDNFNVQMERLIPYLEVTTEEMKALFHRIMPDSVAMWPCENTADIFQPIKHQIALHLLEYSPLAEFKDPQLTAALNIILAFKKENPYFNYDLHTGNFMFRRTSVGVQLVITDPLVGQMP